MQAAGLLKRSERQVRRLARQLEKGGDAAVVHGLCGKRSNNATEAQVRQRALTLHREHYLILPNPDWRVPVPHRG